MDVFFKNVFYSLDLFTKPKTDFECVQGCSLSASIKFFVTKGQFKPTMPKITHIHECFAKTGSPAA